jgi:hypothetical protein
VSSRAPFRRAFERDEQRANENLDFGNCHPRRLSQNTFDEIGSDSDNFVLGGSNPKRRFDDSHPQTLIDWGNT